MSFEFDDLLDLDSMKSKFAYMGLTSDQWLTHYTTLPSEFLNVLSLFMNTKIYIGHGVNATPTEIFQLPYAADRQPSISGHYPTYLTKLNTLNVEFGKEGALSKYGLSTVPIAGSWLSLDVYLATIANDSAALTVATAAAIDAASNYIAPIVIGDSTVRQHTFLSSDVASLEGISDSFEYMGLNEAEWIEFYTQPPAIFAIRRDIFLNMSHPLLYIDSSIDHSHVQSRTLNHAFQWREYYSNENIAAGLQVTFDELGDNGAFAKYGIGSAPKGTKWLSIESYIDWLTNKRILDIANQSQVDIVNADIANVTPAGGNTTATNSTSVVIPNFSPSSGSNSVELINSASDDDTLTNVLTTVEDTVNAPVISLTDEGGSNSAVAPDYSTIDISTDNSDNNMIPIAITGLIVVALAAGG